MQQIVDKLKVELVITYMKLQLEHGLPALPTQLIDPMGWLFLTFLTSHVVSFPACSSTHL